VPPSREFPKPLYPPSLWRPEGWRPRPELNRGTRFCRPLRNHSATWPQCCGYRHLAVIDKIILKPLPCPILKVSSRLVRPCYCVVFPAFRAATSCSAAEVAIWRFLGAWRSPLGRPLGVALVGALGAVPGERAALTIGQLAA
jgi:hypothetical protein